MSKMSKMDYYVLRNDIIRDLIIKGVITDSDADWNAVDTVLGDNLDVDWDDEEFTTHECYQENCDVQVKGEKCLCKKHDIH